MFKRIEIRVLLLFAVFLSVPWTTRGVLLFEQGLFPASQDLRGFILDAAVAALVSALALRLGRWRSWTPILLYLPWLVAQYLAYEFTRAIDAMPSIELAPYLGDTTFFLGSAVTLSHPLLFLAMLVLAIPIPWLVQTHTAQDAKGARRILLLSALVFLLASWLSPVSDDVILWRQSNFWLQNIKLMLRGPKKKPDFQTSTQKKIAQSLSANLDAPSIIPRQSHPKNVLLLILESVSGRYIRPSEAAHPDMQFLSNYAKSNIYYRRFIDHQRQTNRGEYSLLCGDYPKLIGEEAKMTEFITQPFRTCLPAILNAAGFQTVYLQAAPLHFMMKDQFMRLIGFERVLGDQWFAEDKVKQSVWGPDDRRFLTQSLELIDELQSQGQPWFLSMLTVGTHPPYQIPDDFPVAKGETRFAASIEFLDRALSDFIKALKQRGILDDTLLLITSDESMGQQKTQSQIDRVLSQSEGIMIVSGPQLLAEQVDSLYGQSDVALSITDALGISAGHTHFIGRSLFRRYQQPREVAFGNLFTGKVGLLSQDELLICQNIFTHCQRRSLLNGPGFSTKPAALPVHHEDVDKLHAWLEWSRGHFHNDKGQRSLNLTVDGQQFTLQAQGESGQQIFGWQEMDLKAHSRLHVDMDLELRSESDERILFKHALDALVPREFLLQKALFLQPGQRIQLSYDFILDHQVHDFECRLFAHKNKSDPATLVVHHARMDIFPAEQQSAGLYNLKLVSIHDEDAGAITK